MKIGAKEQLSYACSSSAFHSFHIEHSAKFRGGEADIRRYDWQHQTADSWTSHNYFIDMSLTPRPQPNWAIYRDLHNKRAPLDRIWFVPPGLSIESGTNVGSQRSLHLIIEPHVFDDMLTSPPDWSVRLRNFDRSTSSTLEILLLQLSREISHPSFASAMMMDSLIKSLAILILRGSQLEQNKPSSQSQGGLAPWRMKRMDDRIFSDLPPPTLSELADICGLSLRHLSRAFKKQTGETIQDYVRQAAITRAKDQLASRTQSLNAIAAAAGFSSASSFSYAFKKSCGLTPMQFVKICGGQIQAD